MTKLFSFTLLSKNASANHLVSHSCKNTGLKVPCFHTLTKNIGGRGCLGVSLSDFVLLISYLRFSLTDHPDRMVVPSEHRESRDLRLDLSPLTPTLTKNASASPLDSALTSKRAPKPFRCNTYEKHTQGEGGEGPVTNHQSRS